MREWEIEDYLVLGLIMVSGVSMVAIVADWFYPHLFISLMGLALSAFMFTTFHYQKRTERKKEVILLSLLMANLLLFATTWIYYNWTIDFLTPRGVSLILMMILLGVSIYAVIGYVRLKITYKNVRGNQRHSNQWQVSESQKKQMRESHDIYFELGEYYENEET